MGAPVRAAPARLEAFARQEAAWLDDYALFVAHPRRRAGRPRLDRVAGAAARPRPRRARRGPGRGSRERSCSTPGCSGSSRSSGTPPAPRRTRAGVELAGDLPFMVATDSADVWARRGDFRLDARVGVPPDAFSATGQDWGLPVYRWDVMEREGFPWLTERGRRMADLYGLYRVDHVVGLYRTYFFPADGSPPAFVPARRGRRRRRTARRCSELFSQGARVIAEDLGTVPDFVRASLERDRDARATGSCAGSGTGRSPASRSAIRRSGPRVSVATTGTHDTDSMADWYEAMPDDERRAFLALPGAGGAPGPRDRARFDDGVRDAILDARLRRPAPTSCSCRSRTPRDARAGERAGDGERRELDLPDARGTSRRCTATPRGRDRLRALATRGGEARRVARREAGGGGGDGAGGRRGRAVWRGARDGDGGGAGGDAALADALLDEVARELGRGEGVTRAPGVDLPAAAARGVRVRRRRAGSSPTSTPSASPTLYLSPILAAAPGSMHGYDVVDHGRLSSRARRRRGASRGSPPRAASAAWGSCVDFVPNHMGIGPREPVVDGRPRERPVARVYAPAFDVDWTPLKAELDHKVLVPVLGDQFGARPRARRAASSPARAAPSPSATTTSRSRWRRAPSRIVLRHRLEELAARLGPADPHFQELESIVRLPREARAPHRHLAGRGRGSGAGEGGREAPPRRAAARRARGVRQFVDENVRGVQRARRRPALASTSSSGSSTRRPTASRSGASPGRRSTTGASST